LVEVNFWEFDERDFFWNLMEFGGSEFLRIWWKWNFGNLMEVIFFGNLIEFDGSEFLGIWWRWFFGNSMEFDGTNMGIRNLIEFIGGFFQHEPRWEFGGVWLSPEIGTIWDFDWIWPTWMAWFLVYGFRNDGWTPIFYDGKLGTWDLVLWGFRTSSHPSVERRFKRQQNMILGRSW
jgi:hypothetical protein